jgi:phospholipid-translocating ATPase
MVCPSTGTRPLCNTSDLNEELGQIQYLFTDKTGTLTDNDLILRCCSVNGVKYMYDEDRGLLSTEKSETSQMGQNEILSKPDILRFLEAIAVCHTVKVLPIDASNEETTPRYQCESLDEEVLVKASHRLVLIRYSIMFNKLRKQYPIFMKVRS